MDGVTPSSNRVHMVIKTSALEYDDRLRKEVASCQELGFEVSITCMLDKNHVAEGSIWGGADFKSVSLVCRRLFPSHKFLALHLFEFVLRYLFASFVRSQKVGKLRIVWLHDPVLMPLLPILALQRFFGAVDRIVWDQHELPPEKLVRSRILKPVLRWLFGVPDCLIAANQDRVSYLDACRILPDNSQLRILHNYADDEYAAQPKMELETDISNWLNGEPYILVQSGGTSLRNAEALFEALFLPDWPDLKVIFVGGADTGIINSFKILYSTSFDRRVWIHGKVPQFELARFADNAVGSIILYRSSTPNQIYCEPNRMYQALCRGIPVIVGDNPPMADVIKATGAGIVLSGDGRDSLMLALAAKKLISDETYRKSARLTSGQFRWKSQHEVVAGCLR